MLDPFWYTTEKPYAGPLVARGKAGAAADAAKPSAGAAGSGGAPVSAGGTGSLEPERFLPIDSTYGCACRVGEPRPPLSGWWGGLALAALALRRRSARA